MASASKDTGKLIAHAIASTQKVVDADTEVSTIDLALLANLNTNQFLNYIKLDQQLGSLEEDTAKMTAWKKEADSLTGELDHIENQVDALVAVTDELSAWCDEIAGLEESK
ncbi:hypothetical protein JCM33374_g1741 [Metschnikowia sp. JCM 33374]|nr:hypothetical protein JCM33374_g1741 [Metschnikowia sp. JCM 33374]